MRINLKKIAISTIAALATLMGSATISHSQSWQEMGTYGSMAECEARMQALVQARRISQYTCTPLSSPVRPSVQPLDTGTSRDLKRRSVNDGMTPDHIPSFAAIRRAVETRLGYRLTESEAKKLRDITNTIVYSTRLHQQYSRTYGGRNHPTQILQDSRDLQRAFIRDMQRIRPHLIKSGYTPQQVDAAFEELDILNRALGLY